MEEDVESAHAGYKAHCACANDQVGSGTVCATAKLEVRRTKQSKGEGNKEEDPDEDDVGAQRGKGEEVDVDGPKDEVEPPRVVVHGWLAAGAKQEGFLNGEFRVQVASQAEPKGAKGAEDECGERVANDKFEQSGNVQGHSTHKVVRSNEAE